MKIISIGTNHAGTSMIRTLKKANKDIEITTYDRNSNISFLGCGIALWVGGEFDDPSGLFYATPESLTEMGINVKMEHDVIEVNEKEKYVVVKDLKTNQTTKDHYDKLVVASGTWPIVPPFEGVNLKNIFLSKLFQHAQIIKETTLREDVKNIVVIGAGYIGVELLEAFNKYGKNATLIDMADRVIPNYFDEEFTKPMQDKMTEAGVNLRLGEKVQRFIGNEDGTVKQVVTDKGTYDADMVIMSIGFKPNTELLKDKVEMTPTGAIKVDRRMKSSNPDIYAIGDSAAIHHNVLDDHAHVALATNAVKTGITAALDIAGAPVDFPGVQGTNAINVFDCNYASTGFTEVALTKQGIDHKAVFFTDYDRPEFMHNAAKMMIKMTYDPKTLRLLGAQIGSFGETNHTEVIFTLSLAIEKKMTLPEIALMDFFFLPHYNKPFNFIIQPILNSIGLNYKEK